MFKSRNDDIKHDLTYEDMLIVLDKLVGPTSCNGDTHFDSISLKNTDKFKAVCDFVKTRINDNACHEYDQEYSSKSVHDVMYKAYSSLVFDIQMLYGGKEWK